METKSVRLYPPSADEKEATKVAYEYAYPRQKGKIRAERAFLGLLLIAMLVAGKMVADRQVDGDVFERISDTRVTEVFSEIGQAFGGENGVVSAFSQAVKGIFGGDLSHNA